MKAWTVQPRGWLYEQLLFDEQFSVVAWADTREKARSLVCRDVAFCYLGLDNGCYTGLVARRCPAFDGQPRDISSREGIEAGIWTHVECYGCLMRREPNEDTVYTWEGALLCEDCASCDRYATGP